MENRGGQVTRQWRLLRILDAARLPMSVRELWERLDEDVTERTVRRDLDQLLDSGWPLTREDEGWTIDRGAAMSLPIRTTHLMALMLATDLLAPLRGTLLESAFDELRRNLLATLNPSRIAYLDALRTQAAATLFHAPHYERHAGILETVSAAIAHEQVLELRYAKPNATDQVRLVEPYGTWVANGRIYLVGHCRSAADLRTFALQRISAAEMLDETFERPAGFDIATFARRGFGVFHGPVHRIVLTFDADVAHLARERRFHDTQEVRENADGSARVTFEAGGLPEIAAWIAGFGGRVQVVRPLDLRDLVVALHREGLRRSTGS